MTRHIARALAFDIATGGCEVAVRSQSGVDDLASVEENDQTEWRGANAFNLNPLPDRLLGGIAYLEQNGWSFQPPDAGAALSFSVRQHDMVLARDDGSLLMDGLVLGWRCNAAVAEVAELRTQGAEHVVGRIEPRFILPKLMYVLTQAPELRREVRHVMTTGDYVAWMLTGERRLSTSDALSNGLLVQETKRLAANAIRKAGLDPAWFPPVVQSGTSVGTVGKAPAPQAAWNPLRERLEGWRVVAGLGDNHATAVGCGLSDEQTVIVSAGNSGTVNRMAAPDAPLAGRAACFEYYNHRMLLMMLADCAVWYDRFVKQHRQGRSYEQLNELALESDLSRIRRVEQRPQGGGWVEAYPDDWASLTLGEQTASTQFSIALELLLLVREMLAEVQNAPHAVNRFVLTGGLSQSPFFQHVFVAGCDLLATGSTVALSDRRGKLASQTAAYGALINAMLPGHYGGSLQQAIAELCPLKPGSTPDATRTRTLEDQLRRHGLT